MNKHYKLNMVLIQDGMHSYEVENWKNCRTLQLYAINSSNIFFKKMYKGTLYLLLSTERHLHSR